MYCNYVNIVLFDSAFLYSKNKSHYPYFKIKQLLLYLKLEYFIIIIIISIIIIIILPRKI